jgi:chromosome segregation ATPase
MATQIAMDIHRVASETRNLMTWASQTWPVGADSFEHLYQAIVYHIKCSSQTLPAVERDRNRLVGGNRELQAEKQKLDDEVSTLDRACKSLQDEVKDGKKMIANHLRTIDSYMANNSYLREELGKARELQKLTPSHDDLVASVSRLEEELHTTRDRLKFTIDRKRTVTDINEELKNDLKGVQAATNDFNNLINAQRKEHELARSFLEREKGAFETGLKYTKAREDLANRHLHVAYRELQTAKHDIADQVAGLERLRISNQDLSRRLREQERVQLEAEHNRNAAEDRCRTLQDELRGAIVSLEGLKVKAEEAEQACSQVKLEVETLQRQLGDEVKTTTELTSLIEQQQGESKARLEEEQTKSRQSQAQQDRLATELTDADAIVQRLESELKAALFQVTVLEEEKADLSADLDASKSSEQHYKEEHAEYTAATELLNAESERLLQEIEVLKERAKTEDEKMTSLRGRVQELESALENSQNHATTSERAKSELREELKIAREREGALDQAHALHNDEMAALKTDHSKMSKQLEILRKELEYAERRADTPQSPSDGITLDPKHKTALDKANESTNDTTVSCICMQRQFKDQRRGPVDASRKPSDATEELTKIPTRPTPATTLRPEETLYKQPHLPAVEATSAVTKPLTLPPLSQPLAKPRRKTTSTPGGVIQASVPSSRPDPKIAAAHDDASDPTPLSKKHTRAADCDEQAESKMSKRARRRKRHRESLGVPGGGPE